MRCLTELKPVITLMVFTQYIQSEKKQMSNRVAISFVYIDIVIKFITETYLTKFYVTKFISALFNCHQPIIHLIAKLIPLFKQRSLFLPFFILPWTPILLAALKNG